MINEALTVQEGHFRGVRVTPTIEMIAKLMEDYHKQFEEEKLKTKNHG